MSEYHKIKNMTDLQVAYFAGLLDGEGCVRIGTFKNSAGKLRYRAHVVVGMTDIRPINWLYEHSGGHIYVDKKLRKKGSKLCFCWNINASEAAAVLTRALPLLLVKHNQAENVLAFVQTLRKKKGPRELAPAVLDMRKKLFLVSKSLNQKGRAA